MSFIGIDLGTTNSCVSSLNKSGKVEILANQWGERVTPSFVAFTEYGRDVGKGARLQRKDLPSNTIFSVKRIIGRDFDEQSVQDDLRRWPFEVINDDGRPKIQVRTDRTTHILTPEQISAEILSALKKIAEERRGKVYNAVVTVPAYFNESQRRATMVAAEVADLDVPAIINEPTAAAIAYAFQNEIKSKRTVLVYDLGGGTFDVTLLTIEGTRFDVIGTGGDTHLGGDDFNQNMLKHLLDEFEKKHGTGIRQDKRAMVRLYDQCEETKINLTRNPMQSIRIEALHKGKDFSTNFTRAVFDDLNEHLFRKTFDIVENVLSEAGMEIQKVDDVLLVGGSSRIPYIQKKLAEMFGQKKIRTEIEPDEAVAYGAGVYAARISGQHIQGISDLRLNDVTPLSLGIEVKGGITSVIMKRNTQIPARQIGHYVTVDDNQTEMTIEIYEGERTEIRHNHRLGGFRLTELPPMPAGKAKVDVKFVLSENGLLDVSAWETTTANTKSIVVDIDRRSADDSEILKMIQEANKWRKKDEEHRVNVSARNELEAKILELKRSTTSVDVLRKVMELRDWLNENKEATTKNLVNKLRELEALEACKPKI